MLAHADLQLHPHSPGAFSVDVASGMPVAEAFVKHHQWRGKVESIGREAGKVERRPKVATRITELRNLYAQAAIEASRGKPPQNSARSYTVADSMAELDQARDVAIATNAANTLVRSVEVRMKLYGLGIADARNPTEKEEMSPEELEEALAMLRSVRQRLNQSEH